MKINNFKKMTPTPAPCTGTSKAACLTGECEWCESSSKCSPCGTQGKLCPVKDITGNCQAPSKTPGHEGHHSSAGKDAGIAIGVMLLIAAVIVAGIVVYKKRTGAY
jgi:hypothetical protein